MRKRKEIEIKEKRPSKEEKQEPAQISVAIRKLYLDNQSILNNIGRIEKQEHDLLIAKSECILALAKNIEKLHELEDYKEPIHSICSTIVGLVKDRRGFFASESWIRDILPIQYREPLESFNISELLPKDHLSSQFEP